MLRNFGISFGDGLRNEMTDGFDGIFEFGAFKGLMAGEGFVGDDAERENIEAAVGLFGAINLLRRPCTAKCL